MKKIALFGDSIRKGYDRFVQAAFKDIAEVFFPEDNCRFAEYTLRQLHSWKNEFCVEGDFDLVHWNAGLWDCLIIGDGEKLTPIEIYSYYIDRLCKYFIRLFPNAKIIFATSTPVIEHLFVNFKRFNADIEAYNNAAVEIVKKYGFEVDDLYAAMKDVPDEYHSGMTHFYTLDGSKAITAKVIESIENCLGIKASEPDYAEIFEKYYK